MRVRPIYIVFLLGALVFWSCQKEYSYEGGVLLHDSIPVVHDSVPVVHDSTPVIHDSTPPVASTLDTFFVTIDGTLWVAQNVSASEISGQLGITGATASGTPSVSLLMPSYVTVGSSVTLDVLTETNYIGIYNPATIVALGSTSGTLTILENNTATRRIRGNFHFIASDPTGMNSETDTLTNGYFSAQHNP